ncbi:Copper resistance protein (plasmid) [Rhodovulum sp. P5]|uniref:copper resistance CopC family protein n=1 Tax=Rhodovulum sp. P5 TaxID=1564506 RepID=UPI0009C32D8E|nr:copper resistance protein CopC [Rhodovulum sp. P5]ARE42406.1 Copper resistance protein [Rhodovulum sp. P5]
MTPTPRLALAAMLFSVIALPVFAHSQKEATYPADGASLNAAPEVIAITFDSPMRLTLFRLTDGNGSEIDVTRTDGMQPVTEFEAMPASLSTGTYDVEWRGLSGDGHPMKGSFSFTIAD